MTVTLIAAAYNASAYLPRFFASLDAQTYTDFVVVFVDDCSTDGTFELAARLGAGLGERMHLLRKERNTGLVGARNAGLDYVTAHPSPYISFLDADDFFEADYVGDLLRTARETQADLVVAGIRRIDEKSGRELACEMVHAPQSFYADSATCDELAFINPCSYAKLYRFDAVQGVRFRNIARSEDTCYLFEALPHLKRVAFTNRARYTYCVHEDSLSGSFDEAVHASMHDEFAKMLAGYAGEGRQAYRAMFETQVFIRSSVGGLLRRTWAGARARSVAREERAWLDEAMPSWRTNPYLSGTGGGAGSPKRRALRACAALYKCNAAPLFVVAYNLYVRATGKEVRA